MDQATIVIPLLEQRPVWLEQSVKSALCQTVPCAVIVVQSHGTPESNRQVLYRLQAEFRQLRILTADQHCGYACAFNLGIQQSDTERIGFLLADDWLEDDAVEHCLPEDTDIVSTQMNIVNADGTRILEIGPITKSGLEEQPGVQERADYLGHFLLLRRKKILEAGGVDTTIGATGPDDYDLLWSMLELGASATVIERALYNYRDHNENWRLSLKPAAQQNANLEKILTKHDVPEKMRPTIRRKHVRWFGKTIEQVRRG